MLSFRVTGALVKKENKQYGFSWSKKMLVADEEDLLDVAEADRDGFEEEEGGGGGVFK
jgi:hypothetical protein